MVSIHCFLFHACYIVVLSIQLITKLLELMISFSKQDAWKKSGPSTCLPFVVVLFVLQPMILRFKCECLGQLGSRKVRVPLNILWSKNESISNTHAMYISMVWLEFLKKFHCFPFCSCSCYQLKNKIYSMFELLHITAGGQIKQPYKGQTSTWSCNDVVPCHLVYRNLSLIPTSIFHLPTYTEGNIIDIII